jgi:hypothetical protein
MNRSGIPGHKIEIFTDFERLFLTFSPDVTELSALSDKFERSLKLQNMKIVILE